MLRQHLTPPDLKPKDILRFWSYVPFGPPSKCWPWVGYPNKGGYGLFRLYGDTYTSGGNGRPRRIDIAHRVMFFLLTGEWPSVVRHKCDNPPCVNPHHLIGGTVADNNDDRVKRGRSNSAKGTRNAWAKLTEDDVRYIRQNYRKNGGTKTGAQLAEMFNVTSGNITHIAGVGATRRSWKHLD